MLPVSVAEGNRTKAPCKDTNIYITCTIHYWGAFCHGAYIWGTFVMRLISVGLLSWGLYLGDFCHGAYIWGTFVLYPLLSTITKLNRVNNSRIYLENQFVHIWWISMVYKLKRHLA